MTGRIVKIDGVADVPWKNGGGTTRELASYSARNGSLAWRISVATIARSGPFSLYPAIDRTLVVISGSGLLRIGDNDIELQPFSISHFDGETPVLAIVRDTGLRVINIMSARYEWSHQVELALQGTSIHGEFLGERRFFVPLADALTYSSLVAGDLVPLGDCPIPRIRPAVVIAFKQRHGIER